jgi:NAD(P)H-nitrite reductase large subunit
MNYVIIGNGVAGIMAAETIRQTDPKGNLTIIGDETFDPYCRPMISLVLDGSIKPEQLPIRKANFYEEMRIEPVLGNRVSSIDVDNQTVSIGDNRPINYDKLLIASGADPRPIKAKKLDLKNISYMRTEAQVRTIVGGLPRTKKALVLGGGLVGFKAAYGLLRRGLKVTMLIRSDHPLSMQVDEQAGKMILEELRDHGLEVQVGVEVTAFEGNRQVRSAHLSDGQEIECDMVVIGKGVLPALDFVPRDKIEVDLGIMVNQFMETTVPGIFAAGDVAEWIDVARNTRWVNAIWPEAVTQGRIAAMNMAGRAVPYNGSLSRNVIRIFGLDVMAGGMVQPPSEPQYSVVSALDRRGNTYRKLVFDEERLVGMVMVNAIEQGGILLSLIHSQTPVTVGPEMLLQPSFNFGQLMMH